ncbi:flagellar basal-body MS-ring/collar protein FliF [Proteinivorax hydrogeniformans]|uniref:Flagellar M-ring protein n=1 Tax=Proteinivorax hydrogeniformans TaxID=1826727 RepID=A0AAU8HQ94_9FIRM
MNELKDNIANQMKSLWSERPKPERIKIMAAIFFLLITATSLGVLFLSSDMEVVYSELSSQDVSQMTIKLREMGVDYEVKEGGTAIAVPKNDADDVRVFMSTNQLPRSSGMIGYERLENVSSFAPESERQILYLQALQEEIIRNIELFPEVNRAQVNITPATESIYTSNREEAKAAVTLFLDGVTLSANQVNGIKHLVANSVEGLSYEGVFVTDQDMTPLDESSQPTTQVGDIRENLAIQNDFERNLQNSLESLLGVYFDYDNVAVNVNAELNFDHLVRESELFDPLTDGEQIVRSMEVLEEHFTGQGIDPVGEEDIPTYPGVDGGATESEKRHEIINHEINKVKEHLVVAPGSVDRLSVAVLVNGELGQEESEAISDFVAVAAGLDVEGRADQINVMSGDFAEVSEADDAVVIQEPWLTRELALIALAGLGLIIAAVFGVMVTKNRNQPTGYQEVAATTEQEDIDIQENNQEEKIKRLASKDPKGVSKLIKSWIAEE